jgi:hypothetical protein
LTGGDVGVPGVWRGLDLTKVDEGGGGGLTTWDDGQKVRRLTSRERDSDRLTLNDGSRRLNRRLRDDRPYQSENSDDLGQHSLFRVLCICGWLLVVGFLSASNAVVWLSYGRLVSSRS